MPLATLSTPEDICGGQAGDAWIQCLEAKALLCRPPYDLQQELPMRPWALILRVLN